MFKFLLISLLVFSLQSCTVANRSSKFETPDVIETEYEPGKGDAYLYDVKIYHQGKKNSVRLDIYQLADQMSFFARGYLGKGVMKGLIRGDSSAIYFPTDNQFFSGQLNELVGDSCAEYIEFEKMIAKLFRKMPSEVETGLDNFYINIQSDTGKKKNFRLVSKSCGHFIELEYRFQDNRFILNEIDFKVEPETKDDHMFRFTAKRRTSRVNVNIPEKKLRLDIPPDAIQINL